MNTPDLEPVAAVIREARKNKGLSQRALGERVGIPQSHISKIESGAVDLQTSSLMQIARALDLELTLIPRTALSAVRALNAVHSQDESPLASQIGRELAALRKATDVLIRRYPKTKALERLTQTLADVRVRLALPQKQAQYIMQALEDLGGHIRSLRKIPASDRRAVREVLVQVESRERALRDIRNAIAHGQTAPAVASTPAYQLGDGDEVDDEESGDG